MDKCKVKGCEKEGSKAFGFCVNHYYHYRNKNLDIDGNWLKQMTKMRIHSKICMIDGCNEESFGKGHCKEHYRQYVFANIDSKGVAIDKSKKDNKLFFECMEKIRNANIEIKKRMIVDSKKIEYKKGITPEKIKEMQSDLFGIKWSVCIVKDCNEKHFGNGFCRQHHNDVLRTLEFPNPLFPDGKKCLAIECKKIAESKGFCHAHYYHFKAGNLDENGNWIKEPDRHRNVLNIETCLVGGCEDKHLAKGLCQKHYSTYVRRNNEEWIRKNYFNNESFKCADCGKTFEFCQIDFHHLRDKLLKIGEQLNSSAFSERLDIIEELKKGIWLCARCHNNRHYDPNLTFLETKSDKKRAKNIDEAYLQIMLKYGWNCKYCGEILQPRELEFHHEGNKDENISNMIGWQKIETIFQETDKCDIVCRNCHRLVHFIEDGNAALTLEYFNSLFELNQIKI